jgi:transposase
MNPLFLFAIFAGKKKARMRRPTSVLCPKCGKPAPIPKTAHGKCTVGCSRCKFVFSARLPKS